MNRTIKALASVVGLTGLATSAGWAAIIQVGDSTVGAQAADLITTDTTWTANNEYVLEDIIYVTSGATLTIEAGTIIRGQPRENVGDFNPGTLVITSDGFIDAQGNPGAPIVFTTAAVSDGAGGIAGHDTTGDPLATRWEPGDTFWVAGNPTKAGNATPAFVNGRRTSGLCGGIIILGDAPINWDDTGTPGLQRDVVEGLPTSPLGEYGGDRPQDNSGIVRYLSISHGGSRVSANNEINGLTMAGVGSGTTIEYIEVYRNEDDGIEWFGGTVDGRFLLVRECLDDGLDVDLGYIGRIQNALVINGPDSDLIFEWDGDEENEGFVTAQNRPITAPVIYNFTGIGTGTPANLVNGTGAVTYAAPAGRDNGISVDDNCQPLIYNGILYGVRAFGLDTDEDLNSAATDLYTPLAFEDGRAQISSVTFWLIDGLTTAITDTTGLGIGDAPFAQVLNDNAFDHPQVLRTTAPTATEDPLASPFSRNNIHANPGIRPVLRDADGAVTYVNPVPLRPGFGGSALYVTRGASDNPRIVPPIAGFTDQSYRGAFSNLSSAVLWTSGWTISNAQGTGVLVTTGADLP